MKTYPLLQSQLGVLLSCVSSPLSTSYNLPTMVQFPKGLGANRLEDAIKRVIARRPVLKTRFVKEENGNIRQYVDESIDIPIVKHTSTESKALLYVQQFVRPFPLFSGQPLCRFEIIETEQWIYLLADFHHTIADGITLAQLFWNKDLPECLKSSDELKDPEKNGRPRIYNESVKPAPTPAMYLHALEEQASFKTPAYHKAATYYQERFKDVEFTRLSTNVANPKGTIIRESAYLPSNDIDQWCDENGVSPNLLLMAAFTLVLSRLSRQQQVAYLTLNHGRTSKHLRNAYGMFVKSAPVAISVDESLSAISFIRSFRKELITTIRYSVYPITHLCRSLQVAPHITFAFQGPSIHEVVTLEGQSLSGSQLFNVDGNQKLLTGSNDLSCLIYQNDGVYEIRTESSEKLNNHSQLKLVAQAVKNCALRMMEDGERILADIGLLSDDEQQHIISLSQGERLEYDKRQTFIDLFLRQAALTPKATAVIDEQGALSYAELDALSADIARQLIAKGLKPNQFVGIMTFRNKEFVAAAIAVERAGGAYLPLDHELPKERLQWIIKDAGIKIVISENVESYESSISSILSGIDRISGISRISASLTHNKLDSTINIATPSSLAYMIYTSGTTGQPKGVVISHSAKLNLIHFITKQWQLTDKSRIACHSSFAFDASVEDLFPVLTVGGTLYIVPENIRKDMRQLHAYLWKNQITGGCYTTTFGVMLAQYGELPVKYLCLGGEQLNTQLVAPYHIFNTYGPTEFTVDATFHELRCEPIDDSNAIGRPLYNLAAYVVDRQGHLLPQGAIGELWLSGCQIAEGYWNQPQLTSEKFTQCRFAKGKVYHTGDLVRWNQDDLLEFIGRTDSQIKLRGYRIELGEIEQAIMKTEGILACKVVLRKPDKRLSEEHLTAYYTAHKEIQDKEFKELLKSSLPSYMIPSLFVRIDKMPLTNNGKTDLSRLPIPSLSSKHCLTPPTNDNETLLCNLFAEVLGIEPVTHAYRLPSRRESVGINDDFFELGGSSIAIVRLMTELEKHGKRISYGDIFQASTPKALSLMLKASHSPEGRAMGDPRVKHEDEERGKHKDEGNGASLPSGDCGAVSAFLDKPMLLTGATGFLGIHILWELLHKNTGKIYCLIRNKNGKDGASRLRERMQYYFNTNGEEYSDRIVIVNGSLPCFNVGGNQKLLNVSSVSTVIHCAADTRFFAKGTEIEDNNISGTQDIIAFCLQTGAHLIHISTSSITLKDTYTNPYIYSKYMAEQAVLKEMNTGRLQAKIMRVGNLSPRSTDGKVQINIQDNGFWRIIQLFRTIGAYPQDIADIPVELSQVDKVAKAILLLATTPQEYNMFYPITPKTQKLCDVITEDTDSAHPITAIDYNRFIELVRHQSNHDKTFDLLVSQMEAYIAMLNTMPISNIKHIKQPVEEIQNTLHILHQLGMDW